MAQKSRAKENIKFAIIFVEHGDELQNKTKIIYGLDADLIMLGLILSCEFKNIFYIKKRIILIIFQILIKMNYIISI